MKILKLHVRIMKIMKNINFHKSLIKNQNIGIQYENYENH